MCVEIFELLMFAKRSYVSLIKAVCSAMLNKISQYHIAKKKVVPGTRKFMTINSFYLLSKIKR